MNHNMTILNHTTPKNTDILTSWYVVPVGSIDDVVVSEEVLVVAGPPIWVGHHLVIKDTGTC